MAEQYKWKFTDAALAEQSGIPYGTIHTQKARQSLPKADMLLSLAEALEVSADYLLTGRESQASICKEAQAVNDSSELQALVRAVMRDPALLRVISAVVESSEKSVGLDRLG